MKFKAYLDNWQAMTDKEKIHVLQSTVADLRNELAAFKTIEESAKLVREWRQEEINAQFPDLVGEI